MSRRQYPTTGEELDERREHAVLVGIDRGRADWPVEESLAELERLAHTAGADVVATITQRMDRPHPRTFIGSGKAEEIARTAAELDASMVVFDDELSPSQQANLEGLIPDAKVMDRTALILDIFALHAVSREGRLQVELAQLEYVLPRLKGMWGHLERERLGGGRGTRFGAGESQLETDRRLARKRISELKSRAQARVGRAGAAAQAPRPQRYLPRGARGLHERRQVHIAQRTDGRRRARGGHALRHSRLHNTAARTARRAPDHHHRHRRLHQQVAPRTGRSVQVNARRGQRGRPSPPRDRLRRLPA